MSISYGGDNISFADGTNIGSGRTGFVNRIINGAMVVSQWNGASSVTGNNGIFLTDRFRVVATQTSKLTGQQNAGSVTPPAGFTNYLGVTSSSAYSVGSGDVFALTQPIEGLNITDLGWGTANAKTVTLSAWVYSSLTGTFGGSLQNGSINRAYPFSYTISSANTWTQISITIAGDTTGTWATNNTQGVLVSFALGAGSTFSGTANAWAAANQYSVTGATSVVGTSGATFYITGVDLRAGTYVTAPTWEFRSDGQELALCQRYYEVLAVGTGGLGTDRILGGYLSGAAGGVWWSFKVTKRANPTVSLYAGSGATAVTWSSVDLVMCQSSNAYALIYAGSTASAEL